MQVTLKILFSIYLLVHRIIIIFYIGLLSRKLAKLTYEL